MKNTYCIAVLSLFAFSVRAQNGSETKPVFTQSNGVVVHESAGNEGFVKPAEPVVHVNPISNWSLPVCIDALKDIEDKLSTLGYSVEDELERKRCLEYKQLVEDRKQELLTNH